jgi:N4-(beta-N-acetylglucosaminyl)-L-asparaginase
MGTNHHANHQQTGRTQHLEFWHRNQQSSMEVLSASGRALDAVEAGARLAEADLHSTSVGLAGWPDRDGKTTLDACIMDDDYNCGSRHVFRENKTSHFGCPKNHGNYAAHHAGRKWRQQWALENGFELDDYVNPEATKAYQNWLQTGQYKPVINFENHDTIGIIALDAQGNLSGACSTSGMAYKIRGRVGDSPIIGAGLYVDNEVGAATATGVGEEVVRIAGTHLVVEKMREGYTPVDACKFAVERMVRIRKEKSKDIQVGFIAINKAGEYGGYCIQPGFQYAVYNQLGNNLLNASSFYS